MYFKIIYTPHGGELLIRNLWRLFAYVIVAHVFNYAVSNVRTVKHLCLLIALLEEYLLHYILEHKEGGMLPCERQVLFSNNVAVV